MTEIKKFTFSDEYNMRFMQSALKMAGKSKDSSTKVGCIIVAPNGEIRSQGFNEFPNGVKSTSERRERPLKYEFTEHAERNAIYAACLEGKSLKDCILYVTFPPCADCTRGIIQVGIREVIYLDMPDDKTQNIPGWRDKLNISFQMFDEAGVIYKSLGVNKNCR